MKFKIEMILDLDYDSELLNVEVLGDKIIDVIMTEIQDVGFSEIVSIKKVDENTA